MFTFFFCVRVDTHGSVTVVDKNEFLAIANVVLTRTITTRDDNLFIGSMCKDSLDRNLDSSILFIIITVDGSASIGEVCQDYVVVKFRSSFVLVQIDGTFFSCNIEHSAFNEITCKVLCIQNIRTFNRCCAFCSVSLCFLCNKRRIFLCHYILQLDVLRLILHLVANAVDALCVCAHCYHHGSCTCK